MSSATTRLTIDLNAVAANYKFLSAQLKGGAQAAGVVKANAYGLGADIVTRLLDTLGCPFFFVATLDEAILLRRVTEKPVAVLGGYLQGNETLYTTHRLIPVINSAEDAANAAYEGERIWHVDTGMNRLGLRPEEVQNLLQGQPKLPFMLMTHFACADEKDHPLNAIQGERFAGVVARLRAARPDIRISMCNSSAIFRNPAWHYDLARPGMALYGLNPVPERENPMHRTVTLETRLIQIRTAKAGESVGYSATYVMKTDGPVGICGTGYADGILRSGSSRANFYLNGIPCPVLGRISMDLIAVDLSAVPAARAGDWLEIIGPNQSPDQLASSCGTIGYEILTSLSRRAERIVLPA